VVWEVLSAVLAEADPSGAGLDVLDAGGGTGGFAVPLAEAGHRVVVVDPSPDSLAALQRRAAERGLGERVVGLQGDLAELPTLVPAGSVDLLLCHSVLEVVDDPAESSSPSPGPCVRAAGSACSSPTAPPPCSPGAGRPSRRGGPCAVGPRRPLGAGRRRRAPLHPRRDHRAGPRRRARRRAGPRCAGGRRPRARSVLDTEPGAAAALLALERALSDRPPFRDVATQLHVLAARR
jgi:SAM-dependent methyltransferase